MARRRHRTSFSHHIRQVVCLHAAALLAAALAAFPAALPAQTVDSALAAYIDSLPMVDEHAHPLRWVAPGAPADTEYDALPLEGMPAFDVPARLRPDNPEWVRAWQAMYGYPYDDASDEHVRDLAARKERVRAEQGARFPAWVLDRAGIDVMLANRVAMGEGLDAPRFRWIAFADPLLLPLDVRTEAARSPDFAVLYPNEAKLLARYERALGVHARPATLDAYVRTVVIPTLERMKRDGTVGIKFEAAYLRPLDFTAVPEDSAARIYARHARAGASPPSHAEYTALENYLMHAIAREAGRLSLPIQIHVLGGYGSFYSICGSEPLQLEPLLNDPDLREARFVIVHGGWPFPSETAALLGKANAYADLSTMTLILSARELSTIAREWLTLYPEKVLVGTDAFEFGGNIGWEEVAWVSATTARRALAMALSGMMADGEVSRARAEQLARMALRDNAVALYHLEKP
ncbi:MAG TPA: hypothetical protein VFK13_06255 [Gemmatimonadaceae bacterium]|nr:hypothetical protein [Gemmatimonadaceae bacterium]